MKKDIPSILSPEEIRPPKNPEENIVYINHFGFKTKVGNVEIIYHPEKEKHELYSFEIRSKECHTHITSNIYKLENILNQEEFDKLISDELYEWLENQNPLDNEDNGCSIKEWNEDLFFNNNNGQLQGAKIYCEGKLGPDNEPWINFYDAGHLEGENFTIEVLSVNESKTQIKLRIEGEVTTQKILFIGWFPLEYSDPMNWVSDFFSKLNKEKEIKTYYHYFNKHNIDQSPEWKKHSGNYKEKIIKIADDYGFTAKVEGKTAGGQDLWILKYKMDLHK